MFRGTSPRRSAEGAAPFKTRGYEGFSFSRRSRGEEYKQYIRVFSGVSDRADVPTVTAPPRRRRLFSGRSNHREVSEYVVDRFSRGIETIERDRSKRQVAAHPQEARDRVQFLCDVG
jgi:hypothetical protein